MFYLLLPLHVRLFQMCLLLCLCCPLLRQQNLIRIFLRSTVVVLETAGFLPDDFRNARFLHSLQKNVSFSGKSSVGDMQGQGMRRILFPFLSLGQDGDKPDVLVQQVADDAHAFSHGEGGHNGTNAQSFQVSREIFGSTSENANGTLEIAKMPAPE